MERQTIHFSHDYKKLHRIKFTTIRGKSAASKYRIGDDVQIFVEWRYSGLAEVEKVEVKRLIDIPIEVLQLDANYTGLRINSHLDFMGLINSLRRQSGDQKGHPVRLMQSTSEEVALIHLAWVRG